MSLHENIVAEMHKMVDENDADIITPSSLAQAAQRIYVRGRLEPHIEYASLEHLKQLARKVLAGRHDAESDENEAHQGTLFSGMLQTRYPIPRADGAEPAYKLREFLTEAEVSWNVATLRKSAEARLEHADALEAWHHSRRSVA